MMMETTEQARLRSEKGDETSNTSAGDTVSPDTDPNNLQQENSGDSGILLTPQSPDETHDLPLPLLQKGWRKLWSFREKRPYFFNKFTRESVWEMPSSEVCVNF